MAATSGKGPTPGATPGQGTAPGSTPIAAASILTAVQRTAAAGATQLVETKRARPSWRGRPGFRARCVCV